MLALRKRSAECSSDSAGNVPEFDQEWIRSFRRRLVAWYIRHGRSLPFRESRDPYRVWISEIMLQQTTVAAVVPYYERFLARFPTIESLAGASEHDVLRLWEGLGYYSRARNLHAAAKQIVAERGGDFPRTVKELATLPGIGRYTAGAIASFAFDEPAPIVEANTLRLYSRLLAYRGDPRTTPGQKVLWNFAERLVPRTHAGRFNHALMDLGAMVCTVREPRCETCPVRRNCQAFEQRIQHEIPVLKPRPPVTAVTEACVVVCKGDAVLLRRRGVGERWAGLWDFPRFELADGENDVALELFQAQSGQKPLPLDDSAAKTLRARLEGRVAEQTGIRIRLGKPFTELSHSVTRFRIRLVCFRAYHCSGRLRDADSMRWFEPPELQGLALSRPARRLVNRLGVIPDDKS